MHLFVLPALYFAVISLVKQSNEELFLDNVRSHARFTADSIEHVDLVGSPERVVDILDSAVLSGDVVFAELTGGRQRWSSSLIDNAGDLRYSEDFAFGEHGDSIYFVSLPVVTGDDTYSLRIGFDESPIIHANERAYVTSFLILGVYLAVILILVSVIGRRVMRPVKSLQKSSRNISSGNFSEDLIIETDLSEFVELSRDLESMRRHLIGINQQLANEIQMKEQTEVERKNLEAQLRHRQRLETVGTLAGGIAHELNNILVPIILYTESAMDDLPADSAVRQDLQRVLRASARARSIVRQVLTFGHQMTTDGLQPLDVADIVEESVDLVRALIPPTARIVQDIHEDCAPVRGDAALVAQVVMNLCTNAYQSLPGATGRIEVSLRPDSVPEEIRRAYPRLCEGAFLRLRVKDDGKGMDSTVLGRILEPFYTTRAVGEGTGLGLSVVHGIVSNMGGEIVVSSKPGLGTTVDVYLPTCAVPALQQHLE